MSCITMQLLGLVCTEHAPVVAELKKLIDGPVFSGIDAAGTAGQQQNSSLFAAVAHAKLQLSALQKQVRLFFPKAVLACMFPQYYNL